MISFIRLLVWGWIGVFSANVAWSGELVLDAETLKVVTERARNQPYRTKGGVFSREFMSFELGAPVTPYAKDPATGIVSRRFKEDSCCFEVSFLSGVNRVKRIQCSDQMDSDLRVSGHPEFRPVKVSGIAATGEGGFAFFNDERSYTLTGFAHDEATIRMDQYVLGLPDRSTFPRRNFEVAVRTRGSTSLDSKSGLQIKQGFQMRIGKFGFMDPREKNFSTSIIRKPSERVFADQKGRILIVNDPLLPGAFRDSLIETDSRLTSTLSDLERRSKVEPVCYRDSGWGSGELGCHWIVQAIPSILRVPFKLLLIDIKSSLIQVLE